MDVAPGTARAEVVVVDAAAAACSAMCRTAIEQLREPYVGQ